MADAQDLTAEAPDLTYESYAADPDYVEANRALIATVDLSGVRRVADLACGTGLLTRLLFARKADLAVTGIDLDPVQIDIATRGHRAAGLPLVPSEAALEEALAQGRGAVRLLVASAMELPFPDGSIDLVTIGNAIHMMPDRTAFLAEVARVLRPGGQLVFNSVFYTGTFVPGTEPAFTEMMKEAVLVLNEMQAERRAKGEPPIPRQRGTKKGAFQQTEWLDEAGWAAACEGAGLSVTRSGHRPMPITRPAMEAIGAYGGLAEVLMSGYPVEVASLCMKRGIGRAYRNLGIESVPRNWLEMTAARR